MQYLEGTRVLAGRARLAIIATWTVIVLAAAAALLEFGGAMGVVDLVAASPDDVSAYEWVMLGFVFAFMASVVLVTMWIHCAHANLREIGMEGLEFTPGWAVGWYFIPIANLIKPYQAMRELWNASFGESDGYANEAPPLVKLWWGCWIVCNILSNVSEIFAPDDASAEMARFSALISGVSSLLLIACAVQLHRLISSITEAQRNGVSTAMVFA